jgi:hypothetical protein
MALRHAGTILDMINEYHPSCQLDDVATLIARNGGAFVDGGPGTGKTRVLLPKILEAFQRMNPEVVFIKAAPTFVAAKQMGGITCQAAVRRHVHNRFENKVMIVDEVSMVSTNLLERMARWSIMGLRFVFFGDFSQLLPGGRGPREPLAHGGLAHLHETLQQPPRAPHGEPPRLRGLAPFPAGHESEASGRRVPRRLPRLSSAGTTLEGPQEQPIAYHVCISHRNRMRINRWQNRLEKDRHLRKLFIPSYGFLKGCSSQPQDMWVWKGLELIGGGRTSRKVLNGVMYRVHSFTDEHLTVQVHRDFGEEELIELPLREASDNLRLCYAAVSILGLHRRPAVRPSPWGRRGAWGRWLRTCAWRRPGRPNSGRPPRLGRAVPGPPARTSGARPWGRAALLGRRSREVGMRALAPSQAPGPARSLPRRLESSARPHARAAAPAAPASPRHGGSRGPPPRRPALPAADGGPP